MLAFTSGNKFEKNFQGKKIIILAAPVQNRMANLEKIQTIMTICWKFFSHFRFIILVTYYFDVFDRFQG